MSTKKKYLIVRFSNGIEYCIPLSFIALHRAKYYVQQDINKGDLKKEDKESSIANEINFALNDLYECIDWACNNMDWNDVEDVAEVYYVPLDICNKHEEWPNAYKKIKALY